MSIQAVQGERERTMVQAFRERSGLSWAVYGYMYAVYNLGCAYRAPRWQ